MLEKGFIGPIGDDLPSLIPIVFALAIFFASFNTALSNFDEKNSFFKSDLEALKIARIMRSNGYVVGIENFKSLCNLVQVRSINYVAGIAELNSKPEDSLDPEKNYDFSFLNASFELKPLEQVFFQAPSGELFLCSNLKNPESEFSKDVLEFKKPMIRVYPIILEKQRITGDIIAAPMQLVVVAWNQ